MAEALEIDHLVKRYGGTVALDDMTFDVAEGQLFGFVGSNGAGKTTTMRITMGVLAADSGAVRWQDRPLTLEARRRIGYMPEERGLYPRMRVGEQLEYLGRLHGLSAAAARRSADEWMARLGVEARRDDEVQKLSLGNQQRVQLAAALVHAPELLVLDEPFSGLDPVAVDVMSQVLREQCDRGVPVLFSSHQLELVERICDRVGIVRNGRLVAGGTVAELRSAGPTELVVDAGGHDNGTGTSGDGHWTSGLVGVTVVRREGPVAVLRLSPDVDDQTVLRAALADGPVHEFRRRLPSLTELFRDVVSEDARTADATAPTESEPALVGGGDVR